MQNLTVIRRSATSLPEPRFNHDNEVAKLVDVSKCIGCKACQVACMEWNELRPTPGKVDGTYNNPHDLGDKAWTVMRFSEHEENGKLLWLIRKDGCMHCSDPGCLKSCPAPGAILQYSNGIVEFQQDNCTGCGYCTKGCPFNVPRVSQSDNRAYKCTLCTDRVAVGQAPACAKTCPSGAISFGSKAEMLDQARASVARLKGRGFDKAGVYDPPGVGGTHVIYVLPRADQPTLYAGLPANPSISALVEIWKGPLKSLSILAMGAAVATGILHYVTRGPNEVTSEDEEQARRLRKGGQA